MCAVFVLIVTASHGSIPEPPLIFYGKVVNSSNELITSGRLQILVSPTVAVNGPGVVIETDLERITGETEDFSYRVAIPIERFLNGISPTGDRLSLSTSARSFERAFSLDGASAVIDPDQNGSNPPPTTFDLILPSDAGQIIRIDLILGTVQVCCLGDGDNSGFVNTSDYRSVRDSFGQSSPLTGDANCDNFVNINDYIAVRDNFGFSCSIGSKSLLTYTDSPSKLYGTKPILSQLSLVTPKNIQVNQTLQLDVLLSASNEVSLAGAFISYDSSLFVFESGSINTSSSNELFNSAPKEVEPGIIAFSAGLAGENLGNTMQMASLNFKVKDKEGSGLFTLLQGTQRKSVLLDADLNSINTSVSGAKVQVMNDSARLDQWMVFEK